MFENVKKLMHYDWNKIIENTVPDQGEQIMKKSEYQSIINGCFFHFGAFLFKLVFSLGVVFYLNKRILSPFFNVQTFGLKNHITIGQYSSSFLFVGLFLYVLLMKEKRQKAVGYFVVLWILLVDTIKNLVSVLTLVASCFLHPLLGVVGFLGLLLSLLGNANILVGCIDFCMRCKKKKEKTPSSSEITTKPIGIKDITLHEEKVCKTCHQKVNKKAIFCPNCGSKL